MKSIKIQASSLYGKFGQSNLDLNKFEQKLDDALENETNESLSEWLLEERIKQSAENYHINNIYDDTIGYDVIINTYIAGAQSESARNYWVNKIKLETNAE